ncbi:MAG TPA: sigma-70 family RNA polymerase sigma factor [Armatimonadota bacterium]
MSSMPNTSDARSIVDRFEGHLTPVLRLAYGAALNMTRNRDDAEDLVQEAMLRAFRAFNTFQEGTRFQAWFLRILTNLFRQKYRERRRQPETISLEDAPDYYLYNQSQKMGVPLRGDDPASLFLRKLDEQQVMSALASIPEEYRLVSTLYFVGELSYQEIADTVGCPVGTVRSRLHRGRKMLQKTLWEMAEEKRIIDLRPRGG